MSLCVYLQQFNQIIIGADTAITRQREDGQRCRDSNGVDKLIKVGKYLLFVCGDLTAAMDVVESFKKSKIQTVPELQRIIRQRYRRIIREEPERIKEAEGQGTTMLNVVCFEVDANGRTISHLFNPNNGFKDDRRLGTHGHTHLIAGGYQSDKALELAIAGNTAGTTDPKALIRHVFESLAGTDIGGELTLYVMDTQGAELVSREKIKEAIAYPVIDFQACASSLTGGTIIGAVIRTSDSGARYEVDSTGWRTYDSSNRQRISINANDQYGMSAIQFAGTNGGGGYVNGGDSLFSIVTTNDMLIAALGGNLTIQGNVNFSGSVSGIGINTISGLQTRLNSIDSAISDRAYINSVVANAAFDPSSRNLKFYNQYGTQLFAVNIPA